MDYALTGFVGDESRNIQEHHSVLETGRLTLKPLCIGDTNALHRICNEPLVRRYLWDDEPVSRATIEKIIAQSMATFSEERLGLFGLRLRSREDLAGFCGFAWLEGMEEMELAYELLPELWGKGLATEAARACLRYAFEEVGRERVLAGADAVNAASLRVIEKLGMKPVGNINPRVPEAPYYALYREDFFAEKSIARAEQGGSRCLTPYPSRRSPT